MEAIKIPPENLQAELRKRLRELRETSLGSYEKAGLETGFNKNTIASYEKGVTLPDIDFLFVFADHTGADINELIRLRLACSRYESARVLVGAVQVDKPVPPPSQSQSQGAHSTETPYAHAFPVADPDFQGGESLTRIVSNCIVAAEQELGEGSDRAQQITLGIDTWGALGRLFGGASKTSQAEIPTTDLALLARFIRNTRALIRWSP